MSRVVFFYFGGTNPLVLRLAALIAFDILQLPRSGNFVAGLNGRTVNSLQGDPFPALIDPNLFEVYNVEYPALGFPMKLSILAGINKLVALINRLPAGQKFMIGGTSQGAAVAGSVMRMILQTGEQSHKAADFLGGVCFGSPIRQTNYRGEVGGSWSGCWDEPTFNTGGHGCFPASGPIPRLSNCDPTRWIEFAEIDDVITSTGDSPKGQAWVSALNGFLNLTDIGAVLNAIGPSFWAVQSAIETFGKSLDYVDATGVRFSSVGNGHLAYSNRPPPGDPDNGLTSVQIALKWLNSKALQYATSPILMQSSPSGTSSTTAGWTTSLTAP